MNTLEVITEGIVFFKYSRRLRNVANKLQSKLAVLSKEQKEKIRLAYGKFLNLADKFEEVEDTFKKASKEEKVKLRAKYEKLKEDNKELIEYVNKEEIKKILMVIGVFTLVAGVLLASIKAVENYLEDNNVDIKYEDGDLSVATTKSRSGLEKIVDTICKRENIDVHILKAIAEKESRWNASITSKMNDDGTRDIGLFQLNSKYIKWFEEKFWTSEEKFDPKNPEHNTIIAARYLKSLLKKYNNDLKKALYAYNAGPTSVANNDIPQSTKAYAKEIMDKIKSAKA